MWNNHFDQIWESSWGGSKPPKMAPKTKFLNCSTKKFETHNVGRCLWVNYLDQNWGSSGVGQTPPKMALSKWNVWTAQHRKSNSQCSKLYVRQLIWPNLEVLQVGPTPPKKKQMPHQKKNETFELLNIKN